MKGAGTFGKGIIDLVMEYLDGRRSLETEVKYQWQSHRFRITQLGHDPPRPKLVQVEKESVDPDQFYRLCDPRQQPSKHEVDFVASCIDNR